ncbi:MAG: hypothetical protein AB7G13_35975 [Lautropia sp.]
MVLAEAIRGGRQFRLVSFGGQPPIWQALVGDQWVWIKRLPRP